MYRRLKTIGILIPSVLICHANHLLAQQRCVNAPYLKAALQRNARLVFSIQENDKFIRLSNANRDPSSISDKEDATVTTIPVVVHVIFHLPEENIPDQNIFNQLAAMNRDYRRMNADSINTPSYFEPVAADCRIEFALAKVDPQGMATTGIDRVYSPVSYWDFDDKMKFSANGGANAWDADNYMNIWVCNLRDVLGYSSVIGDAKNMDGIVVNYSVFNDLNDGGRYHSGRTAVHEAGHWLGLIHLWGDEDCGDDKVADTPKQTTYTTGCPKGVSVSCNNDSLRGDMYMNYMDYTDDPCMNLFTKGQRDRMRALFYPGGYRYSILSSKALGTPTTPALPYQTIKWSEPRLYPNPFNTEAILDLRYDPGWIGKEFQIINTMGQTIMHGMIHSPLEGINTGQLKPGIYFLQANKDGTKLLKKLVKL